MVMTFSVSMGIVRPLLNWKVASIIKFNISNEVAKQIATDLKKPRLFDRFKLWLAKRKDKKVQDELYKPIMGK